MVEEFIGLKGEPTAIILLNGHGIKLPTTFLSLYPQVSVALRPHHRSIFVDGD